MRAKEHKLHAFHARQSFMSGPGEELEIYYWQVDQNSERVFVPQPIVMVEKDDICTRPPTLCVSREAGQALLDDLWHMGLRPSSERWREGVTGAQDQHIETMRAELTRWNDVTLKLIEAAKS